MIRIGTASTTGFRERMEDRSVVGSLPEAHVLGVFDGHGGLEVVEHASSVALSAIGAALAADGTREAVWRAVFRELDLGVAGCGSTATVCLLRAQELSIAWVGDSRAVLVRDHGYDVLTPAHRIDRLDELARVKAAGAQIKQPYVLDPLTSRGLMITRSLGDRDLRRIGVIPDPETVSVPRGPGDIGLVLATDGLWETVSDDEIARICRTAEPQDAADRLLEAVQGAKGDDNATVIVVGLREG
jgi:serine/threonine protein phosphatase PrpC